MATHRRPIVVDDREINVVAISAVSIKHVLTKNTFFHRAEPQNRSTRLHVLNVGLELDAPPLQNFARVPALSPSRLGIDVRARVCRSNPRPPDLQPPVLGIDLMVACRPNGLSGRQINRRKWKRSAPPLSCQRRFDERTHRARLMMRRRKPGPDRFIGARYSQIVEMSKRQRLEGNTRSRD